MTKCFKISLLVIVSSIVFTNKICLAADRGGPKLNPEYNMLDATRFSLRQVADFIYQAAALSKHQGDDERARTKWKEKYKGLDWMLKSLSLN